MKYTITKIDIVNAITYIGQEDKLLWNNANDGLLDIEIKLEYEKELMDRVKEYLKKEHYLIELDTTNDDILDVWYDYYEELHELIDNYSSN